MTKHKHTPGPWFVESSDKTPIYVSPVDRHEQIAICNVMVIDEDGDSDSGEWINGDQTKANARLIATAPMLLADLSEAAAQLRKYETLHRAKGTEDSLAKAEVNAELASRFEQTIAQATS
ncbi:TPA: hypothetical protein QEM47_000936 [Pseudomonas putida]|uniref:hypothetical protein n=1 Tax=Pseudomonas putida TaxID=303 RepID=UPI000A91A0CC|nr:hypothetical protein [Pseudomonas putida]MDD2116699.1 hypothetical protein [Pseudomonas putida]UPU94021.1 hypothetical protein M0766_06450 [Pseudomonas putida]HDS1728213.1 hypothetical protein [Pseudomonas putida]